MQEDSGFRRLAIWQKILVAGLLSTSFALILTAVWLDGYFCHNRPKDPSPAENRVYRTYVCHGGVVYLTRSESILFEGLPVTFLLLFGTGAFLGQRWARASRAHRSKQITHARGNSGKSSS